MKKVLNAFAILLIIISCYGILSIGYSDYKLHYEFCVLQGEVWPVNCSSPITFKEYKQSLSFVEAINRGYIHITDSMLFYPCTLLLSIAICILICTEPFKKSEKKKRKPNPLKLIIGIIPFLILIIYGIYSSIYGIDLHGISYGFEAFILALIVYLFLYFPIFLIALCLIFTYISDLPKKEEKNDK